MAVQEYGEIVLLLIKSNRSKSVLLMQRQSKILGFDGSLRGERSLPQSLLCTLTFRTGLNNGKAFIWQDILSYISTYRTCGSALTYVISIALV